jgi:hypothetical protein
MDRLKSLVSIALCALLGVGACARHAPTDRAMASAVAPIPAAPQNDCSEGDWTKAESYQESKSLAKQLNNNADEEERRHRRELAAVTGNDLGAKFSGTSSSNPTPSGAPKAWSKTKTHTSCGTTSTRRVGGFSVND